MENANFMAIDCETATPQQFICQIGMVIVRQGKVVKTINRLIQPPNNDYHSINIMIHGITPSDTADAPTFVEVWEEIKDYFENELIVAHNGIRADFPYIRKELNRHELAHPSVKGLVDTMEWFGNYKLTDLCDFYNIDLDSHHDALADALACANVYIQKYNLRAEFPTPQTIIESVKRREKERAEKLAFEIENADPCNCFYGKGVLCTGFLGSERDRVKEMLLKCGAVIKSGVSRNVNVVIKGDEPGPSKMKKLEEFLEKGFEILVLEKDEFYEKLKQ